MHHKKLLLAVLLFSVLAIIFILALSKPALWHETDSTLNLKGDSAWHDVETWWVGDGLEGWSFKLEVTGTWRTVESWQFQLSEIVAREKNGKMLRSYPSVWTRQLGIILALGHSTFTVPRLGVM